MNNSKHNNIISYLKIFIYGIIAPSIISFTFYYTFSTAIKQALKESINETFNKSISKKIKESIIDVIDNLKKINPNT